MGRLMLLRKFVSILQSRTNRLLLIIKYKMLNLVATCIYHLRNESSGELYPSLQWIK